jgi:branched-chain amino acid transport system permease protein
MIEQVQYAVDALSLGSLYALAALGVAVVFGVMRLINFAHGELIMIGSYAVVLLADVPWPVMIVVALATVTILALAMERLAFRPVRDANPATLLITSFTLSYLLQSLVTAVMTGNARPVTLPDFVTEAVMIGDLRVQKLDILTVGVTIALVASLAAFLKYSSLGIHMRAAAEDFNMARLLGVNANRVIAGAFGISGLLAGVVTLIFVSKVGTATPAMGVSVTLVAFTATVVGGMGSIVAAGLGGFILGVGTQLLQVLLPTSVSPYRDAFVFAAVIGILLIRPQGLLVKTEARTV